MSNTDKSQQLFDDQYSLAAHRVRLYMIRHGQQETNDTDNHNPGLTKLGTVQAQAIAERLMHSSFRKAYISPMERAIQTAEPLLKKLKGIDTEVTPDLREIAREHMLIHLNSANQEIRQMLESERDALHRFVNRVRHNHVAGEQVLIIAHGNIIRTLIPLFGTREPADSILMELCHASLCIVDLWPISGRAVLILGNCTRHLEEKQITI